MQKILTTIKITFNKDMVFLRKPLRVILACAFALVPFFSSANAVADSVQADAAVVHENHSDVHHVQEPQSKKEKINAFIDHHLQDSHDFTFFSDEETGKHYGFSLPVIIYDNGLKVFSSSKFNHGETVAEVDGNFYKLYHGKIYKTDAAGTIEYDEAHHPTNAKVLDFSITKNVVGLLIACFLLFVMFTSYAKQFKKRGSNAIPTGFARVLEPLVIYVRDEIARPNIGEKKYKKFMPYLLTVFFLIWLLNLLGLTPMGINVTGNIAVTLCLALFTFFVTQFSGTKDYWKHIFWMPGVPVPMKIVLMPIEVLGMFTKPFSLMIRLFANITAGHAIVMGLIAIAFLFQQELTVGGSIGISFLLTMFISIIELLVAFLQAFIFTMLSSLFIGMAVEEHHDDHH